MSYSLSSVLRRGIRSTIRSRFSQDLKKKNTPSLHVRRYQNNGGSLSKVEGALRLFEMDTDPLRAKEQLLLASEEENLPPQTYAEVCYALGCLFEAHSDLLDEEDLGDGVPRPDPAAARAVLLEVRELRREARRGRRAQRRRQEGEQGPAALGQVHRVGGWRAPAAAAAAGGAEGGGGGGSGGGGGGGGGVSVECEEAWGWHLRAAERGHIGAMVRLGHMCLPGAEDTPENSRQLLKWYMAAATAAPLPSPPPPPPPGGPSSAALAAEGGAGGGGEGGEAAWWWEEQWREVLRANSGGGGGGDDDGGDGQGESGGGGKGSPQAEALYGLGAAHEQGVLGGGAPPDPALARRFYLWAGALGAPSAAYLAGHRLLHHHGEEGGEGEGDGDGGPRGAAELGLGLVESAARQGHAGAQGHLAALCRAGHGRAGLAPDPARFRFWAQKAASAGDPFSQAMMGDAHFHGLDGVQRDLPKAFRYYEAAANQGHAEACYSVGVMLYHGFGVEQSYEDSFRYYQYAAERGAARAWRNLAAMHAQGLGVPRSEDTARHILKVMGDAIRQADQEEEEKAGSNGF